MGRRDARRRKQGNQGASRRRRQNVSRERGGQTLQDRDERQSPSSRSLSPLSSIFGRLQVSEQFGSVAARFSPRLGRLLRCGDAPPAPSSPPEAAGAGAPCRLPAHGLRLPPDPPDPRRSGHDPAGRRGHRGGPDRLPQAARHRRLAPESVRSLLLQSGARRLRHLDSFARAGSLYRRQAAARLAVA